MSFDYDLADNPTTFRSITQGFNLDNQFTLSGFNYDGNGNPATYSGASFGFDAENRLTSISSPAFSADYDGDDLRVRKTAGGKTTYFLADRGMPVLELDSTGSVQAANGRAADGWRARFYPPGGGSRHYYVYTFDPQGNLIQRQSQTNSLADAVDTVLYDAFGAQKADIDAATGQAESYQDPVGFGGQWGYYTDIDTGLLNLTHRYYDPGTGRFLNRDPIGYDGGINLYGFAGNNPVNEIDPFGLQGIDPAQRDVQNQAALDWLDTDRASYAASWRRSAAAQAVLKARQWHDSMRATEAGATALSLALGAGEIWTGGKLVVESIASRIAARAASRQVESAASNRALHELYKAELRREMAMPHVEDTELADVVQELYRPDAKIGSGSTAAAIREELKTGARVGGKFHAQKGKDALVFLEKWLKTHPTASSGDRAAAENIILDMKDAMGLSK